jgi:hypothetical protein
MSDQQDLLLYIWVGFDLAKDEVYTHRRPTCLSDMGDRWPHMTYIMLLLLYIYIYILSKDVTNDHTICGIAAD